MHSNRLAIVTVPQQFLVDLFDAITQRPAALRVPYFEGLPLDGGLRCEAVQYNLERRGFDVLLSHPSFAEVPAGDLIPRLVMRWAQWVAMPEYQQPVGWAGVPALSTPLDDLMAAKDRILCGRSYGLPADDVAPTAVVGP